MWSGDSSDSDVENVVKTHLSKDESGKAAVEAQSSRTEDSYTEVGDTASNGKEESVADADNVVLSRDKSVKWNKIKLSVV